MKLHLEKGLFTDLIDATAKDLTLPFLYVEKDYWVSYVLKSLASSEYSDIAIFKGGTSLSKAYKIIESFSEDIDLAVITN
jgi:predicted nucleotidyltransferase component of viral defense system